MNNSSYTCIFGGGAIRGLAYIGAMSALNDLGIVCDKLVGSSVGAIFASLYALGYSTNEAKSMMLDFNGLMFKDINFGLGADFAFSKGDIFENWLREKIEKKFYGDKYIKNENPPVTFRNIDKELFICSTDLATNSQFIFSKSNTPDFEIAKAVRISSGFPGLMKPVEYENKLLVDGDLAKSLPLWKCSDELVTPNNRIIEFRLEGCRDCLNIKNTLDYFNAVYSTISNFSTEHIINLYKNQDKIDYILIDTKDVLLLDFQLSQDKREEISKNGYDTTINYFTKTLVEKKKEILPLYQETLKFFLQLKSAIKKGNASSAKRTLTSFICDYSEKYCNMDFVFVDDFSKFKNSLLKDIKERKLIPIQKIEAQTEHIKVLQGLIEKCQSKIDELENDIEHFSSFQKI